MAQNSWNRHLKSFRRRNKAMNLEEVLKEARKSYKGGVTGVESSSLLAKNASSVGGGETPPVSRAPSDMLKELMDSTKGLIKSPPPISKGGSRRQSRRQTRRSRR
jgi:hypothetical protein